ncbi:hypothetical protein SMIR_01230 [Streptomyces mirabilis]|uniref:hypothetical protein n=1 Tax=Streptomyces mirabilis TaxID=68239 RepID=UPI001BB03E5A|nr:hypothetical protein [Streptomyces mirabilis]QUW77945.1 hypothetical protein SMIR_01230 [Streptomyces mirabilis]
MLGHWCPPGLGDVLGQASATAAALRAISAYRAPAAARSAVDICEAIGDTRRQVRRIVPDGETETATEP